MNHEQFLLKLTLAFEQQQPISIDFDTMEVASSEQPLGAFKYSHEGESVVCSWYQIQNLLRPHYQDINTLIYLGPVDTPSFLNHVLWPSLTLKIPLFFGWPEIITPGTALIADPPRLLEVASTISRDHLSGLGKIITGGCHVPMPLIRFFDPMEVINIFGSSRHPWPWLISVASKVNRSEIFHWDQNRLYPDDKDCVIFLETPQLRELPAVPHDVFHVLDSNCFLYLGNTGKMQNGRFLFDAEKAICDHLLPGKRFELRTEGEALSMTTDHVTESERAQIETQLGKMYNCPVIICEKALETNKYGKFTCRNLQ